MSITLIKHLFELTIMSGWILNDDNMKANEIKKKKKKNSNSNLTCGFVVRICNYLGVCCLWTNCLRLVLVLNMGGHFSLAWVGKMIIF